MALPHVSEAVVPRVLPGKMVRDALMLLVITRGLLMLVALAEPSLLQLPPNPYAWSGSSQPWLTAWARWDAEWYVSIVQHGYQYRPGVQSNVAFAPLFPALMKVGG